MPRTARASAGGYCYHVINRGNARSRVFHKGGDYEAFLGLMAEASVRTPLRVLSYCLMPNHFHFAVWPLDDGDLSRWMQWLLTAHVRRYHRHNDSTGHVWQGRFKAFPIQEEAHLVRVIRYIERNPLRSGLVDRAEKWRWSSLSRVNLPPTLSEGPVPITRGPAWNESVNAPMTEPEVAKIRESIRRNRPLGDDAWISQTAATLGLESSLRAPGRPRKAAVS